MMDADERGKRRQKGTVVGERAGVKWFELCGEVAC